MVIRDVVLRGAGLDFRLSNREEVGGQVEAWLTDLAGWFGGVGVSDTGSQRKLGHGFFSVPSLRTSREMTLSGTLIFMEERDRSVADRFLSGMLWDGEFGELEVSTDELTLVSRVKLAGEIKHAYAGTEAINFQIPLTAPDPFLYAPARTYQIFPAGAGEGLRYPLFANTRAPSSLDWGAGAPLGGAAANQGNADAYPVYTVHGSWPAGFRITTGRGAIEYPSPVHPSNPVRIDNRTGEVMAGGIDQTYRLTTRDWVAVPAGAAIQPRITPLAPSTGWCDVTIQDTYI